MTQKGQERLADERDKYLNLSDKNWNPNIIQTYWNADHFLFLCMYRFPCHMFHHLLLHDSDRYISVPT